MSKHQAQSTGKYLAEKDVLIYEGKAKKVYSVKNILRLLPGKIYFFTNVQ